jgi:TPR repeat protein
MFCNVKFNCLTLPFLILLLGSAIHLPAQQLATERKDFEATRAKAEKGDAEAQLDLGFRYANGNGVAGDYRKAAKWHRKAAEQGLAIAQFVLATDYANGVGVKTDLIEAARWYHHAAEQHLPEAQFALGKCYAHGEGVSTDVVEAVKWYQRAAEQNFVEAIAELGQCYMDGTGVTKDVVEGVKWIRNAAEQGHASSQNRLGLCYLKGEGMNKDYVQAHKWFNLAAAQGGARAIDFKLNLAKAEANMTPEQISQAQQLAHEFKPHLPSDNHAQIKSAGEHPASSAIASGNSHGGLLSVDGADSASELYVDGAFIGNPPAKLHLQEGQHVIEMKNRGFKDYRKEIKVSNGSELNLHVTLEKL